MKSTGLFLSMVSLVSMGCHAMQTQFFVRDEQGYRKVQRHDVSPFLRSLSPKQLQKYSDVGNRIKVATLSNGDYRLQEEGTLNGGGGLLAALAVTATVVGGGIATLGAAAGTLVTAGPVAAGVVAVAGTKATCAAAVYVAIVTTVAPTP